MWAVYILSTCDRRSTRMSLERYRKAICTSDINNCNIGVVVVVVAVVSILIYALILPHYRTCPQ